MAHVEDISVRYEAVPHLILQTCSTKIHKRAVSKEIVVQHAKKALCLSRMVTAVGLGQVNSSPVGTGLAFTELDSIPKEQNSGLSNPWGAASTGQVSPLWTLDCS